jgi:hypothetical protein
MLPQPVANVPEWPGQNGGFLGSEWDPWVLRCDLSAASFQVPELTLPAEVPPERLAGRRSLLDQVGRRVERWQQDSAAGGANRHTQQALDMLIGARVRRPSTSTGKIRVPATAMAGRASARDVCWPGGWSKPASASCSSTGSAPRATPTCGIPTPTSRRR